ncbi:uncharacterized protein LY89DRAFT_754130 [Mollisia scopiformis]|uniref:Uncharacterized protein n=1 Tax=Mollisia scopiformis TaxID=149040 RepID=A0A194WZM9_MOLSC|nr:uncharacterized protein LY89DRAFT_754130 [Mollisia scopiformis]KUJ13400.1 hypothetical protein LY89DRAFT_754130 [Mollisia scopiformis]
MEEMRSDNSQGGATYTETTNSDDNEAPETRIPRKAYVKEIKDETRQDSLRTNEIAHLARFTSQPAPRECLLNMSLKDTFIHHRRMKTLEDVYGIIEKFNDGVSSGKELLVIKTEIFYLQRICSIVMSSFPESRPGNVGQIPCDDLQLALWDVDIGQIEEEILLTPTTVLALSRVLGRVVGNIRLEDAAALCKSKSMFRCLTHAEMKTLGIRSSYFLQGTDPTKPEEDDKRVFENPKIGLYIDRFSPNFLNYFRARDGKSISDWLDEARTLRRPTIEFSQLVKTYGTRLEITGYRSDTPGSFSTALGILLDERDDLLQKYADLQEEAAKTKDRLTKVNEELTSINGILNRKDEENKQLEQENANLKSEKRQLKKRG